MAIEAPPVPGRAPGAARPRPKREREEEVLVWPDLVFVEFISAVLFTITFVILSVLINAPLLNRANTDVTPNPSKAPWYFLNLQELLLHMDKAWAGVLLPTIALGFFAAIPYLDRSREAQGIWFGTKYSVRITIITVVYATLVCGILVAFDAGDRTKFEYANALGTDDGHLDWPRDLDRIPVPFNNVDCCYGSLHLWKGMNLNIPDIMANQVIPISTIALFTVLIISVLLRLGWVRTRRDVFITMFTGVLTAYLVLSLVGSFFRGQGQALIWPWEIKVDPG